MKHDSSKDCRIQVDTFFLEQKETVSQVVINFIFVEMLGAISWSQQRRGGRNRLTFLPWICVWSSRCNTDNFNPLCTKLTFKRPFSTGQDYILVASILAELFKILVGTHFWSLCILCYDWPFKCFWRNKSWCNDI